MFIFDVFPLPYIEHKLATLLRIYPHFVSGNPVLHLSLLNNQYLITNHVNLKASIPSPQPRLGLWK